VVVLQQDGAAAARGQAAVVVPHRGAAVGGPVGRIMVG
jgi:hypothetical protein